MDVHTQKAEILTNSPDREALEKTMSFIDGLLSEKDIKPTPVQYVVMMNHVNEMIKRSITQDRLPEFDLEMFADVSEESLGMAMQVVECIGKLSEEEGYLLSIHFETAKNN
ncbi:transcriptional antiterminator [Vagococcus acidifermentans]|uniref:transcriptional antiterminator n=1 Tax=Vagococcus acidifermentans TaxID=564710 RepID=UPI00147741EB|nr:transcriptional antiterminator [Vagococcus acidifermentans]